MSIGQKVTGEGVPSPRPEAERVLTKEHLGRGKEALEGSQQGWHGTRGTHSTSTLFSPGPYSYLANSIGEDVDDLLVWCGYDTLAIDFDDPMSHADASSLSYPPPHEAADLPRANIRLHPMGSDHPSGRLSSLGPEYRRINSPRKVLPMSSGFCGLVWRLVVECLTSMTELYSVAAKVGFVGLPGCLCTSFAQEIWQV